MSKILIVEDDSLIRIILTELLKVSGHEVDAVGTCAAAQEKMHNGYDLFIVDLGLPDGDGREIASELRAAGNKRPIIAFSGREEYEMEKPCLTVGMSAYVKKGNHAVLLEKVEELLGMHAVA